MIDSANVPVDPIRVLVTDVSDTWYQQIAELIHAEPNMTLVGRVAGRIELMLAVGEGIEVLVLGAVHRKPLPGICSHLLNEYPDLKILVLSTDTGELDMYWRGLRRKHLGSLSVQALLGRIRELRQLGI